MSSELIALRPYRPIGLTRPRIMGIVNVTPDSFSDGGDFLRLDAAIVHAEALVAAGAQLVDVGGESTRPGAERVSAAEEQRRVLPVIEALVDRGIPVSVDTLNASTALAAAELGVVIINDVSAGLADPGMARVAAETGLHFLASHWAVTRQHRGSRHDRLSDLDRCIPQALSRGARRAGCSDRGTRSRHGHHQRARRTSRRLGRARAQRGGNENCP